MATDNSATDALQADTLPDLPETEDVSDHPRIKELEEKLAAVEHELSTQTGRLKAKERKETAAPQEFVTKQDLWERDNAKRIDLVEKEYQEILEKGFKGKLIEDKEIALELAEKIAQVENPKLRIDTMSQPSITTRDYEDTAGLSSDEHQYWLSKGLTKEQIARIVPVSKARQNSIGIVR